MTSDTCDIVNWQAINPIEMVMEAVAAVQKRFYEDYPPHPKEKEYNYKCSSTMKPTQMKASDSLLEVSSGVHGTKQSLFLFRSSVLLAVLILYNFTSSHRIKMVRAEHKCEASVDSNAHDYPHVNHASARYPLLPPLPWERRVNVGKNTDDPKKTVRQR